MNNDKRAEMLAAALYEIRILLSNYLGSNNESSIEVRLAAHLAYALHNEAEGLISGDSIFEKESTLAKIKAIESVVGFPIPDTFKVLTSIEAQDN